MVYRPCLFVALAALCWFPTTVRAADLTVNGEPPVGAFGVDTLEHIDACGKLGMNLIYTYQADAGKKQLDLNDPMGKAVAERKMKVMYILAGRFTRVRLAKDILPEDTTIPVTGEGRTSMEPFAPSGMLNIEGEKIAYVGRTPGAFTGCTRGVEGTTAARHSAGLLLCNSGGLREEILAIKDSPNLWGFWLVDDARPYEGDSLREMSRVIRQHDRRADGSPYRHVIVMGVGGMTAMANFSKGCCDALGVYLYPYRKGKLDMNCRRQMDYIMTRARSEQPDIGLIGVYQAFAQADSPVWKDMPTPEQVREDIVSYFQYGAVGAMGFIYHWQRPNAAPFGFDASPPVCAALAKVYAEIREGKIKPSEPPPMRNTEWFRVLTGPEAAPSHGLAVLDLADAGKLERLAKSNKPGRVTADAHEVDGRRYPARMTVPKYDKDDPKGDRWPGAVLRGDLMATTDWSNFRYIEHPLYNPQDHTVLLRVWLKDAEGGGWSDNGVPVPPRTPALLRLPISEASLAADVKKVQHWMLWFNEPNEDIVLSLGSPILVEAGK